MSWSLVSRRMNIGGNPSVESELRAGVLGTGSRIHCTGGQLASTGRWSPYPRGRVKVDPARLDVGDLAKEFHFALGRIQPPARISTFKQIIYSRP